MNKTRSNELYLEKGKWLESGEIVIKGRAVDSSPINTVLDQIKSFEWKICEVLKEEKRINSRNLTINELGDLGKSIYIEDMNISLNIASIDKKFFNNFINLTKLHLQSRSIDELPEFLFIDLKKLKEFHLIIRDNVKLNKNHFSGLENLHHLNLSGDLKDDTFAPLTNLKELALYRVKLYTFSFNQVKNLENLEMSEVSFSRKILESKENLFKKLPKLKHLVINVPSKELNTKATELLKQMTTNLPANVESLETDSSFLVYLNKAPTTASYMNQLKHLVISFEEGRHFCEIKTLFENDSFPNLEDLHLDSETHLHTTDYYIQGFKEPKQKASKLVFS